MDIKEIRAKYPQYSDIPDEKLLQGLHAKFYSDIPYEQFSSKITGLQKQAEQRKPLSFDMPTVGVTEPLLKMATGMVAKPVSEVMGLAATAKDYLTGNMEGDPEGFKKDIQNSLTYEPKTAIGQSPYHPVNALVNLIGAGMEKIVPDAPTSEMGQTETNIRRFAREAIPQAINIGLAAGIPKVQAKLKGRADANQAKLDLAQSQNAATDSVMKAGHAAGYKFTPDELRKFGAGHPIGSAAEDVSAMHVYHLNREANALDAKASIQNYGNTIKLIRDDLKQPNGKQLPAGTAISNETLDTFIKQHGKVYAAVAKQKSPVVYTDKYTNAVKNIESDLSAAKAQYPDLNKNPDLQTIQESLLSGKPSGAGTKYIGYETEYGMPRNLVTPASTNAKALIQQIKVFRDKANRTLSRTDIPEEAFALAKVQKKAAGALEDLLIDHLKANGQAKLADTFLKSRTQIAKAYNVKNALDDGTVVNTTRLARNADSLTGNLKTIVDMRKQHPNLMLDPRTISTKGMGLGSSVAIGTALAASGHPVAGLAVASRPLLSPLMMSKAYQNKFGQVPTYQNGALTRNLPTSAPYIQGATGASLPYLSEQEGIRKSAMRKR